MEKKIIIKASILQKNEIKFKKRKIKKRKKKMAIGTYISIITLNVND